MGQVALGFKNLLIKFVIFVMMASLLAWALGGTLWPSARLVDGRPVDHDGASWFWRMEVHAPVDGATTVHHRLMRHEAGERKPRPADDRTFADAAGLVRTADGLWFAARPESSGDWTIERVGGPAESHPDRLAVETRLAELRESQADASDSR